MNALETFFTSAIAVSIVITLLRHCLAIRLKNREASKEAAIVINEKYVHLKRKYANGNESSELKAAINDFNLTYAIKSKLICDKRKLKNLNSIVDAITEYERYSERNQNHNKKIQGKCASRSELEQLELYANTLRDVEQHITKLLPLVEMDMEILIQAK